jgi:hypothetical protein
MRKFHRWVTMVRRGVTLVGRTGPMQGLPTEIGRHVPTSVGLIGRFVPVVQSPSSSSIRSKMKSSHHFWFLDSEHVYGHV